MTSLPPLVFETLQNLCSIFHERCGTSILVLAQISSLQKREPYSLCWDADHISGRQPCIVPEGLGTEMCVSDDSAATPAVGVS